MSCMTMYGSGKKKSKPTKRSYEHEEIVRPDVDSSRPYNELCKFAEEFKLRVELDKPFSEFKEMRLIVKDGDEVVKSVTLEDFDSLDKQAGTLLNQLGKEYK